MTLELPIYDAGREQFKFDVAASNSAFSVSFSFSA
jgi:hypothetical protein